MNRLFLITFILLLAVFLRVWRFSDAPPGLQHDELFKAQEGQALIQTGDFRLFYPSNQGHEGGYVWLNGLSYALFGANRIMIKMPPLWCGLLTLAMLYRLGRDVFNRRVALLAMGLAAVSFWTVFTNRVGIRANLMPLVTLWVLWGIWKVGFASPKRQWGWAIFTGLALGFAIYTYTSSFALYIACGGFALALLILDRQTLRNHLPEWVLIAVLGGLLTLPMIQIRLNDPEGQNRASTITQPYAEFREGKPDLLLENARKLALMFVSEGDPEWRYNVAGRPLFFLPIGLLVYLGFGLMLWRSRHPFYALLVILALVGLLPSLLTTSAPSYLRSIVMMPCVMLFIALAVDEIGQRFPSLNQAVWALGVGIIAFTGIYDAQAYFGDWLDSSEVFAIYRDDLEQLASYLKAQPSEMQVFATTGEPSVLDPAIFSFSSYTQEPDVVWFNGAYNIIGSHESQLLFVSPLAPMLYTSSWLDDGADYLGQVLRQDGALAFDIYRLPPDFLADSLAEAAEQPVYIADPPPFPGEILEDFGEVLPYPVNFGDKIALVGVWMPQKTLPFQTTHPDDGLKLHLYFEPLADNVNEPLSVFVHIVAWDGTWFAGRDFLGVPPNAWRSNTIFMQDHYIGGYDVPIRHYFVTLGVYNTETNVRYPILDENGQAISDQVILGRVEMRHPSELDN